MEEVKNSGVNKARQTALLVANWKPDVGYAWWLMESYWVSISDAYQDNFEFLLAYPELTKLPEKIKAAPIKPVAHDFGQPSLKSVLHNLKFLRENNVKWIYFTDKSALSWVYLLYRLAGVQAVIIHDHTPGNRSLPGALKKYFKYLVSKSIFAADGLIAVTDFVRKRHLEVNCFPPQKCFVARNGIRPWGTTPLIDLHKKFNIPAGRKIMVMTGRANRYKGVDFVLQCMSKMINVQSRIDVHFLFCGDGPDLDYFRRKAKDYNVTDFVSFPGHCENIPGMISSCDLAIHASKGEVGYSLSILEYMYAELPVLVPSNTSVCGATEHEETGFIYEEDNIDSAIDIIRYLAENPEIAVKVGANAKESVIRNYNLENTHKQLLASIDNILTQRNLI